MTDRQQADAATAELRQTTVTWATYEKNRKAGKYKTPTHWDKAFTALKSMLHPENITLRNEVGSHLTQATVTFPTWEKNRKAGKYPHPEQTHWGQVFALLAKVADPAGTTSPWTDPPWRGKGVHYAWGFQNGSFTVDQAAAQLKAAGCSWASLEGYPATPGGLDNTPYHLPLKQALHQHGLKYLVWERTDQMSLSEVRAMIDTVQPDGYLADIEVDWGRPENTTLPAELAAAYPKLPRSVLIAGMPEAQWLQSWVNAGFDCMTQAYSGPSGVDPATGIAMSMDADAYWRGWPTNALAPRAGWTGHDDGPHTWPVLEVGSDSSAPLSAQLPAVAAWGKNFSIYCAEIMTQADWNALAAA